MMEFTLTKGAYVITREQVDKINTLLDKGLTAGLGNPVPGQMCVEAAICYALDLPHGDDPGCVIEPLRRLKIRINDSSRWTSNEARASGLRRLAIAQLGSKGVVDPNEFSKRVAEMTIRTVVPSALRAAARLLTGEHPTKLLAIALKCEQEPTEDNSREANKVADAAAAYAAYAATYADASAADAADAAAYAAAYAAYAATYADASAASAAAASAAAGERILVDFCENVVQILIDMKAPGTAFI